jgi:hypothetical protein
MFRLSFDFQYLGVFFVYFVLDAFFEIGLKA